MRLRHRTSWFGLHREARRNGRLDFGQRGVGRRAADGAVGEAPRVGDPARAVVRPEQVEVVATMHDRAFGLEPLALDQRHGLLDSVRPGLAVQSWLQVEQRGDRLRIPNRKTSPGVVREGTGGVPSRGVSPYTGQP